MSQPFSISALRADEWYRWKDIRLTSLAEAPYAFGSTSAEAITINDDEWMSHLDRGPYLIAEQEGLDVGNVRLAPDDEVGLWWLYSLWIAPEARGTGLITLLLQAAEESARSHGARELRLDVARDNDRAIAAYVSHGYVALENDSGSDDLEIVFSKSL